MTKLRPILFLLAAISFGLGISLPLMRFEKLWLFIDRPSLLEVISGLWGEGSVLIALVVALFSILFPILKMAMGMQALVGNGVPAWVSYLAKWSMMDVLLVAIIIFAAKTSGLATAVAEPGVWFYALSSVFTAIASYGLDKKSVVAKAVAIEND